MILRLPFPGFPDGLRGFALLWLRIAVTLVLARDASDALTRSEQLPSLLIGFAALLIGAGFLTPAFAFFMAVAEIAWMTIHHADQEWSSFLVVSILIAITVLGPGAYSIDRWLFGRKRLTIGRPPH